MADSTQDLIRTSIDELQRVLSASRVVGEPITVDGTTIVPLVSIGFGIGAGAGAGHGGRQAGEGSGGGAGGGGGIRPIAVIVVNKDGAKIEPIHITGSMVSLADSIANRAFSMWERRSLNRGREGRQGSQSEQGEEMGEGERQEQEAGR